MNNNGDSLIDLQSFYLRADGGRGWQIFIDAKRAREAALEPTRDNLAVLAKVPIAYGCIQLRAKAVGSVPWFVDEVRFEESALGMAGHVGAGGDTFDLAPEIEAGLGTYGSVYLRPVSAVGVEGEPALESPITRLDWIHPRVVEEQYEQGSERLIGYKVGEQTYGVDEIVHIREWHPGGVFQGLAPLDACFGAANVERLTLMALSGFWQNGGRPLGLLMSDQVIDETQMKRTETWWRKLFGGAANAFRVGIVGGGLRWQNITFSPDELALPDLRREDKLDICAAFRVPPELLGVIPANYATKREARMEFYEEVVIPQVQERDRALNRAKLGVTFSSDVDSIRALQRLRQMHDESGWRDAEAEWTRD